MTQFIHREGPLTAGDTRTALSTQGAVANPGTIIVPSWAHKIKTLTVAIGDNTPTAADGGHNFHIIIGGDALVEGEQILTVGAAFCDFTTAGDSGLRMRLFARHDVDIDVKPNGTLAVYGEATLGTLWGQPEFGVTVQFAP